jgi:hypothetical protein
MRQQNSERERLQTVEFEIKATLAQRGASCAQ